MNKFAIVCKETEDSELHDEFDKAREAAEMMALENNSPVGIYSLVAIVSVEVKITEIEKAKE